MAASKAFNATKRRVVADKLKMATDFLARLKGLLFTSSLPAGQGLYLSPCSAIHMFGMTYAIDAIFVDAEGVVVGLCESIGPGKVSPMFKSAKGCIEVPAGTILATNTQVGDHIELEQ